MNKAELYYWFKVYRREGFSPAVALYWARLDPFAG